MGPERGTWGDNEGELDATRTLDPTDARAQQPASKDGAREVGADVAPGERVAQYVIEERFGAGGMGVVYRATDEQLQRPVAIKFLHGGAANDPTMVRRMVREARLAAKLNHPNVVAIHEVSTHRVGPFIAMEYVDGRTLGDWLAESKRPWRQIVDVFCAAGAGIAHAHTAGVIHRDIKPSNILITDDRVVVADFGIAVAAAEADGDAGAPASDASSPHPTRTRVTGTPYYAPPEQLEGDVCDERSDVYSFCAALYEAVYGERPERDTDGAIAPVRNSSVPSWLRPIIVRGLANGRDDRWPRFEPLLRALERDPQRRRRRVFAATLAGLLCVSAGGALVWGLTHGSDRRPAACTAMDHHVNGVWNAGERSKLVAAFARSKDPSARKTAKRVSAKLDEFAAGWVQQREKVCRATRVHGDQSTELMDRKMQCLDRQLRRVGALITRLQSADQRGIDRAMTAVHLIVRFSCDNASALPAQHPDPAVRKRVDALDEHLARLDAMRLTGQVRKAHTEVAKLRSQVESVGFAPLTVAYYWLLARTQASAGQARQAEDSLRNVVEGAARMGDDRLVARAWLLRVHARSRLRGWSAALELVDAAKGAIVRAGDPADLRANLANLLGVGYRQLGKLDAARAQLEKSVTLAEQALGKDAPELASSLNNLGGLLVRLGKYDQAERALRRAVDIRTRLFGEDHPALGSPVTNLGLLLNSQGRYRESRVFLKQVLALYEKRLPANHVRIGDAELNLAASYDNEGDYKRAREHVVRARAIYRKALPKQHPRHARVVMTLGSIAIATGDPVSGKRLCLEAIAIMNAAKLRVMALAGAQACVADAELALHKPKAALARVNDALAILRHIKAPIQQVSYLRVSEARARWALGERARALRMLRAAKVYVRGAPARRVDKLIPTWIRQLGSKRGTDSD